MTPHSAIRRAHEQAGAVRDLIPIYAFVSDSVFVTKAGHLGLVSRFTGVDADGLTEPERARIAQRMFAALRTLDERFRVYSYLVKIPAAPLVAAPADNPFVADGDERVSNIRAGAAASFNKTIRVGILLKCPAVIVSMDHQHVFIFDECL